MKKILLLLACVFTMLSCSQEEELAPINKSTSDLPVSARLMRSYILPAYCHKQPLTMLKFVTS